MSAHWPQSRAAKECALLVRARCSRLNRLSWSGHREPQGEGEGRRVRFEDQERLFGGAPENSEPEVTPAWINRLLPVRSESVDRSRDVLNRFLEGAPVTAHGDGASYRLKKSPLKHGPSFVCWCGDHGDLRLAAFDVLATRVAIQAQ